MHIQPIQATVNDLPIGHIIRFDDGRVGKRIPDEVFADLVDGFMDGMSDDRFNRITDWQALVFEEGKVPFMAMDGTPFLLAGDADVTLIEEDVP